MTLQEFVNEINAQIKGDQKLSHSEMLFANKAYIEMFVNEFDLVPNFDVDDYGRIELLAPEMMG